RDGRRRREAAGRAGAVDPAVVVLAADHRDVAARRCPYAGSRGLPRDAPPPRPARHSIRPGDRQRRTLGAFGPLLAAPCGCGRCSGVNKILTISAISAENHIVTL